MYPSPSARRFPPEGDKEIGFGGSIEASQDLHLIRVALKGCADNFASRLCESRKKTSSPTPVLLPPLGGEGWGGGLLAFKLKSALDLVNNAVNLFIQHLIAESNHAKAARGKPGSSARVVVF